MKNIIMDGTWEMGYFSVPGHRGSKFTSPETVSQFAEPQAKKGRNFNGVHLEYI